MALRERILDWELGRPDSFAPLYLSAPDPARGKPFPVAWYTSLWHGRLSDLFVLVNADFSSDCYSADLYGQGTDAHS